MLTEDDIKQERKRMRFTIPEPHKCEQMQNSNAARYGHAVYNIGWSPELNAFVMDNQEYASYPIVCCPFCSAILEGE